MNNTHPHVLRYVLEAVLRLAMKVLAVLRLPRRAFPLQLALQARGVQAKSPHIVNRANLVCSSQTDAVGSKVRGEGGRGYTDGKCRWWMRFLTLEPAHCQLHPSRHERSLSELNLRPTSLRVFPVGVRQVSPVSSTQFVEEEDEEYRRAMKNQFSVHCSASS